MAVAVQANLSKIGIAVDIQQPQPAAFQIIYTTVQKSSYLLIMGFNEWSNFNTSLNVFFPRTGSGFYLPSLQKPGGQSAWDALSTKSLTSPAPDPALLKQIGDAFFNDCTVIPLEYGSFIYITSNMWMDSGLTNYGTANAWDYASTWISK
jgi:hypothetical protein